MYRFLDRPVVRLDEHHRFLIAAMRQWTAAAREGRCACRALAAGFVRRGVMPALGDFHIAMATLDGDSLRMLHFGAVGAPTTSDDEARLLALFVAAFEGEDARVRRIAAGLVADDAAARLATAAEWVALHLLQGAITENDE